MADGARQAEGVFQKHLLPWDFCKHRMSYTGWYGKQKTPRLVQASRKPVVTQTTSLYNRGEQKSNPEEAVLNFEVHGL